MYDLLILNYCNIPYCIHKLSYVTQGGITPPCPLQEVQKTFGFG